MLTTQLSDVPAKHENTLKMHMISTLNAIAIVRLYSELLYTLKKANIHITNECVLDPFVDGSLNIWTRLDSGGRAQVISIPRHVLSEPLVNTCEFHVYH